MTVSRRRIGRIMKENGRVSSYTVAQYKPHPAPCNDARQANVLNRPFDQEQALSVVVSDLTYVRVKGHWNYVCFFVLQKCIQLAVTYDTVHRNEANGEKAYVLAIQYKSHHLHIPNQLESPCCRFPTAMSLTHLLPILQPFPRQPFKHH
ncbi:UNVERIFIED_CONTAM: transposase InsO family protein [Paenibacillus sp. PvR008]